MTTCWGNRKSTPGSHCIPPCNKPSAEKQAPALVPFSLLLRGGGSREFPHGPVGLYPLSLDSNSLAHSPSWLCPGLGSGLDWTPSKLCGSHCRHLFHKSCVDPWLLDHRTCPMCKMNILKALGIPVSTAPSQLPISVSLNLGSSSFYLQVSCRPQFRWPLA